MASYQELLAELSPSDMDRRDALTRALLSGAAQAFQGGPSMGSTLGRTMFASMGGYDEAMGASRRERMEKFAARKQAFELAQQEKAMQDQQAMADAMAAAAASRQAPSMPPGQSAPQPAQQDQRAQRRAMLEATIQNLVTSGRGQLAGPLQAELAKMEDEYAPEPKYDQQGRAYVVSKQGGIKYLDGIRARDKVVSDNLGGTQSYRTEYSAAPLSTVARSQSPDSVASNAIAIRGQNMADTRAKDANIIAQGRGGREDADNLRKEFNSLPQVKNFSDIAPIYNAAVKAPDTAAGDFALIYGVGKILDPGSVVREGEMGMVVKSGSPAQRVMGHLRYLQGKGRLTPEARAQLTEMLHNAVSEREGPYKQARDTYEGLARQRNYDPAQVFIGSPEVNQAPAKSGGWTVQRVN